MSRSNRNLLLYLGRRIRDARKKAGLTQLSLADKLGTTQQMISRFESGKQGIRVDELIEIAAKCNVPLNYLLEESDAAAQALLLFNQLDPTYQQGSVEIMKQLLKLQQISQIGSSYITQQISQKETTNP
jgi:transcriptional regulator with XRE-family HTH domain